MYAAEDLSDGSRIHESGYSLELTDNTASMFATFSAVRGNAEFVTQVRHTVDAFAANFTNLAIGNLSTDTNVHGNILKVCKS
jgi:hypothetical protein